MSINIIKVDHIQFTYPDGHPAIQEISFDVTEGESIGIIGANGSGKSTLLFLLLGVLFVKEGSIQILDQELNKKNLASIRKKIGMIMQDSDDQLFMTRVVDDVAFGPRNLGLSEVEIEKVVDEALSRVGITHLKERAPFNLSGGEKKAATIASVLSMNPEILVMDEPTSGLDPKSRRRLIELLNDFEHTKIITSHDLDMIKDTCQRIIIIHEGKVHADGPSGIILSNRELLESCSLELPLSMQNKG